MAYAQNGSIFYVALICLSFHAKLHLRLFQKQNDISLLQSSYKSVQSHANYVHLRVRVIELVYHQRSGSCAQCHQSMKQYHGILRTLILLRHLDNATSVEVKYIKNCSPKLMKPLVQMQMNDIYDI